MRKLLLGLLFAGIISTSYGQKHTTVILVRHAEKAFAESGDPDLTDEGDKRAMELARVLENEKVDAVYSTPFKRTRQTVKYLAEQKSLEIKDYNPFKMEEVVEIIESNNGKTLVFSGHSNTTPALLNKMVDEDKYSHLSEGDYDNLYIVFYQKKGKAKVLSLEYGQQSDL